MAQVILDRAIVEDSWTTLPKDFDQQTNGQKQILPLQFLLSHLDILDEAHEVGVWLDSDEAPEVLEPYLDKLSLIAINFPKFADGRGYSFARTLRDHYNYQGQIRAIGDVLKDQLFYLLRCGFNAFEIREDRDIKEALSSVNDFSNSYQADTDQTSPLFRRRDS